MENNNDTPKSSGELNAQRIAESLKYAEGYFWKDEDIQKFHNYMMKMYRKGWSHKLPWYRKIYIQIWVKIQWIMSLRIVSKWDLY